MAKDFTELSVVGLFVIVYWIDNVKTHLDGGNRSVKVAQFDLQSPKMIEL